MEDEGESGGGADSIARSFEQAVKGIKGKLLGRTSGLREEEPHSRHSQATLKLTLGYTSMIKRKRKTKEA